jgi:hypothetical protein
MFTIVAYLLVLEYMMKLAILYNFIYFIDEFRRKKKRGWQTKSHPFKKHNFSGPDYLGIRNKKAGKRTNVGVA